jgi:hypothetical protein
LKEIYGGAQNSTCSVQHADADMHTITCKTVNGVENPFFCFGILRQWTCKPHGLILADEKDAQVVGMRRVLLEGEMIERCSVTNPGLKCVD